MARRKTDEIDCRWSGQPLQGRLLKLGVVPLLPVRQFRDLTRRRTELAHERVGVINGIRKILEDADINLAGVDSDIRGPPVRTC